MTLKRFKQIIGLTAAGALVSVILTGILFVQARSQETEVIFLDIGQGSATLIKTRYGQNILIDGGPDNRVLDRLGRNLSFFDRTIDIVIASHPDADHIGGLPAVLARYNVKLFLEPGVVHTSAVYHTLEDALVKYAVPVRYVSSRQTYDLGDGEALDVLYPDISFVGKDISNNNDASIVVKFSDGAIDFMITGDAPADVEEYLVGMYGNFLDVEVLEAGHHGSDTSSGDPFLDATTPEVVTISVGADNRYGHPTPRVLNRLKQRSIPILRTDEMGDIHLYSDGEYVELR